MARPAAAWTPALRDGVSASRVSIEAGKHKTLIDFLLARFPFVADWPQRFEAGEVLDIHGRPALPLGPCVQGQVFWYWRNPPPENRVPFEVEVLHRDDHLLVVDKPHFLATAPAGRHLHETALVRLKRLTGIATLVPMHRLDRDTAGVLLFLVQPASRHAYHSLLRDREAHKVYEAVAPWRAELALPLVFRNRIEEPAGENFMQMQVVDGPPNAETRIEMVRRIGDDLAFYRLTPHTGRKHQLRAQMNALGIPIVGDRIYPRLLPEMPSDYSQPLQLLAREIAFTDPISGEHRRFVSRRTLARAAG